MATKWQDARELNRQNPISRLFQLITMNIEISFIKNTTVG